MWNVECGMWNNFCRDFKDFKDFKDTETLKYYQKNF